MAIDARFLLVTCSLLLAINHAGALAAANSAGGQVPITVLGPPRDPQPTTVTMMSTGMRVEPAYSRDPEAARLSEAAAAGADNLEVSGLPAGTAADAGTDMHKSSLPVSYHGDDSYKLVDMVTSSADDTNGNGDLYSDQIFLQPQQLMVTGPDIPGPVGAAGRALSTSSTSYSSTSPGSTTTTTTVTSILIFNQTTSSSTTTGRAASTGGVGSGMARATIPPPAEAQLPATLLLRADRPAATAAADGVDTSEVEPLTGPQQQTAAFTAQPAQAVVQANTTGSAAGNSLQPAKTWSRAEASPKAPGTVGAVAGRPTQLASDSSTAPAGNTTKQAVVVAAAANISSNSSSSSSAVASPKRGLQPAVAPGKPAIVSNSGPQLPLPVPTAYSNVSAPAPFTFKQKGAYKTIEIGCSLPFEGSQKLAGEAVYSALKMAITDLAPKTVPHLNINLTCFNSRCSDIPAYAAVTKFADEGAIAVIGEICSRATVAAAGVANARKIPVISPASTSPSLSQTDYFFRTVPSDRYQGVAAAGLVYRSGVRNVAVVYEDSAYGFGLSFNFIAGFTKDGGNVPVVYSFKLNQGKPADAVAKIKTGVLQNKLDGVFMATNNLTFVADFLVDAKAAKLDNLKYFGGDAIADYTLIYNIGQRPSVLANLTVTSVAPGSMQFVDRFKKFANTKTYNPYAARAYDAMDALLRAYKVAGAPKNGTMIIQQLSKQKFQGVSGMVAFDQYGDAVPSNQSYAYITWNATAGTPIFKGFIAM